MLIIGGIYIYSYKEVSKMRWGGTDIIQYHDCVVDKNNKKKKKQLVIQK